MPRKTKKADLDITAPSIGGGEPHLSGVWEVFEGYEIRERDDGPPYVEATGEVKKTYRPLVDTPHLFLEFARLADKGVDRGVLEGWLEEYGVLGMHYDEGLPYVPVYDRGPAPPPADVLHGRRAGRDCQLLWFVDFTSRMGLIFVRSRRKSGYRCAQTIDW
jgi:hypothetical protein